MVKKETATVKGTVIVLIGIEREIILTSPIDIVVLMSMQKTTTGTKAIEFVVNAINTTMIGAEIAINLLEICKRFFKK